MNNPLVPIYAASAVPRLERIDDYLVHWATMRPGAQVAADDHRRLTYAELRDEVDRLSCALMDKGVTRGACIAMLDEPGCDFLALFLATVSIGAVWVGLNPRHSASELAYVLGDAQPFMVFARSRIDSIDRGPALDASFGTNWIELEADGLASFAHTVTVNPAALAARRNGLSADDVALLVYTSGSTGRPKGAQLHHSGIVHAAWAHATVWQVTPLRLLNNLPISHVGGVCDLACTALIGGGFQFFMKRFDAEGSLAAIECERLTLWGQVPTQFRLSLAVPSFANFDLASLQIIIWSGARAPLDLIEQLYGVCPTLSCSYGMTETVGSVTLHPAGSIPTALDGSIGWPDPERGVRLSDSGEIEVSDPFLMRGYLHTPESGASCTTDGWFRTGDLAAQRPDGSLTLVGRAGEMFKSGGYNVYPREVEEALEALPEIETAIVLGIPDPLWDEAGVAFVMPVDGATITTETLNGRLRATLANYKIPKRFVELDRIPMLAIGKVDRAALKRRAVSEADV
jgi:acyl-CoA synthetase (AMP-forming)/AMP-acid ligase II